jgi:hypothetical protein
MPSSQKRPCGKAMITKRPGNPSEDTVLLLVWPRDRLDVRVEHS